MNYLLEQYWDDLRWEALVTWGRLTLNDLNQVAGSFMNLEKLMQKKYGYSVWESRRQITDLIQKYDNLSFFAACERVKEQSLKFWPNLSIEDTNQIDCSRIKLLDVVKKKNDCSVEQAMTQVNKFLTQFMD